MRGAFTSDAAHGANWNSVFAHIIRYQDFQKMRNVNRHIDGNQRQIDLVKELEGSGGAKRGGRLDGTLARDFERVSIAFEKAFLENESAALAEVHEFVDRVVAFADKYNIAPEVGVIDRWIYVEEYSRALACAVVAPTLTLVSFSAFIISIMSAIIKRRLAEEQKLGVNLLREKIDKNWIYKYAPEYNPKKEKPEERAAVIDCIISSSKESSTAADPSSAATFSTPGKSRDPEAVSAKKRLLMISNKDSTTADPSSLSSFPTPVKRWNHEEELDTIE
jgi:hypothetical protein